MPNAAMTIICDAQGTYAVQMAGEGGEPSQPTPVDGPEGVMQAVQAFLQSQQGSAQAPLDPNSAPAEPDLATGKAAWQQEAANRDPESGLRRAM